jgi:hypothetical protein
VLGLVVGYSGEATSDVHRVADLVATRLASKHLEYARTPKSIAKAMQTQRVYRAWEHSCARGFARVVPTCAAKNVGNLSFAKGVTCKISKDIDRRGYFLARSQVFG